MANVSRVRRHPTGPRSTATIGAIALVLLLVAAGLNLPLASSHLTPAVPSAPSVDPSSGPALLAAATASLDPPQPYTLGPWTNLTAHLPASPSAREGAAMAYDPGDGKVLLFGGYTGTRTSGDTWVYSHEHWTNITSSFPIAPPPRQRPGLVYDTADSEMILFGGHDGTTYLNDTWAFNGTAWIPLNSTHSPSPREDLMMADDPSDNYVVLFGGEEVSGLLLNDTWTFQAGQWSNRTNSGQSTPPARESGGFTWDGADGYDLLFSGKAGVTGLWNDTWSFSDLRWSNLTTNLSGTEPPKRESPTLIYDSADGFVLLFGGLHYPTALNDSWTFEGGRWKELPPAASPSARFDAALTFDPNAGIGYAVLFGGQSSATQVTSTLGDTWSFKVPLRVVIHATNSTIDLGQSTGLVLNVTGGYPPYAAYNWSGLPVGCVAGNQSVVACTPAAAGTFNLTANVTDSGGFNGTSAPLSFQVNPDPSVTAGASVYAGELPLGVNFTANVSGGTAPFSFGWVFDNGATSSNASASQTFTKAGAFAVQVTVTDNRSLTSTANLTITVSEPPVPLAASIAASPTSGVAPLTVQFNVAPSGGEPPYAYAWTFGVPGATSTTDDPSYTYETSGVFEAQVVVTDLAQETVTKMVNITVAAPVPLTASAFANPTLGTAPLPVSFTGSAGGGLPPYQYAWTFGTAGSASGSAAQYTFETAGTYTAALTVTDGSGAQSTSSVTIVVSPSLSTTFAATVGTPYCSLGTGEAVVTVNASATGGVGADTYGWSFPNGIGAGRNASTIVSAGANWTIQLTTKDSDGHSTTSTQSVNVPALSCTTAAGGSTSTENLLILLLILLVAVIVAIELVLLLRRPKKSN